MPVSLLDTRKHGPSLLASPAAGGCRVTRTTPALSATTNRVSDTRSESKNRLAEMAWTLSEASCWPPAHHVAVYAPTRFGSFGGAAATRASREASWVAVSGTGTGYSVPVRSARNTTLSPRSASGARLVGAFSTPAAVSPRHWVET
jgi:hypothetical protein